MEIKRYDNPHGGSGSRADKIVVEFDKSETAYALFGATGSVMSPESNRITADVAYQADGAVDDERNDRSLKARRCIGDIAVAWEELFHSYEPGQAGVAVGDDQHGRSVTLAVHEDGTSTLTVENTSAAITAEEAAAMGERPDGFYGFSDSHDESDDPFGFAP